LDVQLNNQAVASVALNRNTTGEQTLVIPLRTDLLADTSRRDHSIQMTLRAEDHCLANSESRLYIRNDLSFIHFEFREGVPALDLALYPRPLFNEGFVNVAETALVVLPPNASNNDHQAAAGIVAG